MKWGKNGFRTINILKNIQSCVPPLPPPLLLVLANTVPTGALRDLMLMRMRMRMLIHGFPPVGCKTSGVARMRRLARGP
jgi:hypothetical protein